MRIVDTIYQKIFEKHKEKLLQLRPKDIARAEKITVDFEEIEPYEKGFAKFYKENILPEQQRMEALRLKYSVFCNLLYWIAILSFIVLFIKPPLGLLIIVCLMPFLLINTFISRMYKTSTKSSVMNKVAGFVNGFDYDPLGKVNLTEYKKSKIIPKYDRYLGEDKFKGKHKDVLIEFSEADLQKISVDHKGRPRYSTVFYGLLIMFDLGERKYKGHTIGLTDKGSLNKLRGLFKGSLKKVALEYPEFEKIFEVYSDSQVESRVVLDPAFMERVYKLSEYVKEKHNSAGLQFSFYENKCLITIPIMRDLFEVGSIWDCCVQTDYIKDFLKEMHMIMEIAEILKMERKAR